MPRAVLADEFGPPTAYELREVPSGNLGAGQVRVTIRAVGIG